MRRTIAFLGTLWLWWTNYLVYRRRAVVLAWQDATEGVDSGIFDEDLVDDMLQTPTPAELVINPFGRFKDLNERLNDAR